MSTNVILIIAGAIIFLVGLAKMGSSQSGGFSLKNFGITFGGSMEQSNKVGNVTPPAPEKPAKPDLTGLAIAGLGLLTALVGWLKG